MFYLQFAGTGEIGFPLSVISVLIVDDHSIVREGIRRVIETEMNRLGALVDEFLEYSRPSQLQREDVDVLGIKVRKRRRDLLGMSDVLGVVRYPDESEPDYLERLDAANTKRIDRLPGSE